MKNSLLCKCQALFATPSNKKNTTSFNGLLALFIMVMGMGVSWGQIIISQVYEGASNDKWIEITNVGSTSVDLTNPTQFKLGIWSLTGSSGNGAISGTPSNSISLTGSLDSGAKYLIKNTSASAAVPHSSMPTANNINSTVAGFNGNDAIAIFTGTNTIVDAFGSGINNADISYHRNSNILATNTNFTLSEWTIKTLAQVAAASNLLSEYIGTHIYSISYTVTFNANSGSITTTSQTADTATNLNSATSLGLSRSGYIFGGWASSAANATAGTVAYADGASYPFTSSSTLYAIWKIPTWNGSAWSNGTPTSSLNAEITGDLTTTTDLVCKDLTINSGNTLTIGAGKKLTVSGNLINNGTIVFKSDATNTAMFDVFNGTQSGTGVVTVERYIPNKRAWRALTTPLKGSNASIFSQWQNNGSSVSNTGVELWGPGGTGSSGNGLAVGPSSSIMQYNAGAWNPITDTKNTNLFTTNGNNAFMIFPTGAYGSGNIANNTTAVATTLKATGQLITGNVPYTNLSDSNHTLIGNPYASPIDLNSILDANATLQKYFWVWDPNGANQGTYNMFDAIANTYTVTNLSYTNSSVIQSGQAFFVKATTGQTGSFTINENNKSTTSTTNVFRNNTPPELFRVGLYKQENNEWSGRDGAMTVILSDAAANQAPNKMANSTENIAFTKNGASFASNHHLPLVATDVLEVKVWNTTAGSNYKLKLNTEAFTATHLAATLEDLYTNSRTSLNLDGSAVEYPFTVTADALSTGNRFRIVFQNAVLGNNHPTTNGFSIVPNPVIGDSFQVNLGTLATGTYSYSICNAIGQEVTNGSINSVTQNTNYEVKMSNAATGIYIMKIKGSDNSVYTAKIIKK